MPLVTAQEILQKAKQGKYAVPMFDVSNYEMIRGVVDAAEEVQSPVILAGLTPDLEGKGLDYFLAMARTAAETASIPVVVQLDHAGSFAECKRTIDAGITSVMFDGSRLDINENIKISKQICDYAHKYNVCVEAELGYVPGLLAGHGNIANNEIMHLVPKECLTKPKELASFVQQTNVDAVAVAIGTAHGTYISTPELEVELLKKLNNSTDAFLVLHGGSGTPSDQLKNVIANGICKVNFFTDILKAMFNRLKKVLAVSNNPGTWPYLVYKDSIDALQTVVKEKIEILGSKNKA